MARQLGDAFVTVGPDATGFRVKLDAQIKAALAGIKPEVSVKFTADSGGLAASVANMKTRMDALSRQLVTIPIGADDKQAQAVISGLQARLLALAKTVTGLTLSADTTRIDAQVAALRAKLAALVQKSSHLQIDADTKQAIAQIAALELQAKNLEKTLNGFDKIINLGGVIDDVQLAATLTKLDAVEAKLRVLKSHPVTARVLADTSAVTAAITQVRAEIDALTAQAHDIRMNVDVAGLAAANSALLGLEGAFQKAAAAAASAAAATTQVTVAQNLLGIALGKVPPLIVQGNNGMRAFGVTGGWLGGIFAVLGAKVTLFGGLLQGILPAWATHVTVMHLAADILVELIAVWGGAAIAATAFGIAGSDAAKEIFIRMQALHTAADATNQSMFPLTGTMEKLHNAVRPQVYQIFGDALTVMSSRTNDFQKIVAKTGPVVDYLAARITVALSNGKAFDVFTKNASDSLLGLGNSFGNVFGAIGNILNVVPDYAQKLLAFGVVVTRLLENFTAMIEPVLRWGLAIHGAFIYIGLAVTLGTALYARVLVPLTGALVNAGARAAFAAVMFQRMAAAEGIAAAAGALLSRVSPVAWVGLAIAGLTALVLWLNHSSSATRNLASDIVALADAAPITQSLAANARAAAAAAVDLSAAQKQLAIDQAAVNSQTTQYVASGKNYVPTVLGARDAIAEQTAKVKDLQAALTTLQGQRDTEQSRLQPLIRAYGSSAAALGILNAAGITTAQVTKDQGQAWAIDTAEIDGTINAIRAMTGVTGSLENNLEVLGRTETDQYQATQKLNQAWNTFIGDVTSTQGTFDTVALGIVNLNANFAKAGGSGETLKNKLGQLTLTGTLTGASMDGLSQASLDLNQAFTQQVTNTDRMLGSLRTAIGGTAAFSQAVKDAIAPLLRYASGSTEATAQLVALAQEANYTGPVSLKELTKWLGAAANQNDALTVSVKKSITPLLAHAKGDQALLDKLTKIARTAGYTGPAAFKELNKWLQNTGSATKDLKKITDEATTQEALLTGAMQSQGQFLANELIGDINNAILAYDGVQKAATDYGTALAQSGGDAAKAKPQQDALVQSIINAGRAAHDTTGEIAAMISKILHIPLSKAIDIVLQMQGKGNITISGTGVATRTLNTTTGRISGASGPGGGHVLTPAKGLFINRGSTPTADDVAAFLSKGELVVPANMVSAGLVDHLRGRIPGFTATPTQSPWLGGVTARRYAAGGLAGFVDTQVTKGITGFSNSEALFGQNSAVAFANAAIKATQAAAAAAAAAGGGVFLGPGSGNNAADISAVLSSMGLPLSLVSNWLSQIQTESGGNLNAVNLTDSNAQAGHPSVGLLQLIPGTFHAYAGPYVNTPPLVNFGGGTVSENPMAQIYAAIHYASARYGGAAMAGVIGHGHGYRSGGLVGSTYDKGGILPPWGVGVNTSGKAEMVSPAQGPGSLHETNMLLRQMIHAVQENTRVTGAQGQQFAHGIGVAAARGAGRGYYGG
jgi:SLT domain-containing protein/tetrahydromethanopterin S-methyltransferase subunit B